MKNNFAVEKDELQPYKLIFRKYSNSLSGFAKKHGLNIEKYYHQGPSWDFLFRHPLGGYCWIEIVASDDGFRAVGNWSYDDISDEIYYSKRTDFIECGTDKKLIIGKLEEIFTLILAWTKKDLELIAQKRTDITSGMTVTEYQESIERQYPMPIP